MKDYHFSFLAIGKTQDSSKVSAQFARYVGLASTFIKGVNPTKAEADTFFGYESKDEPVYVREGENGKEALITFLLQTDPDTNNGIELKTRATFQLRLAPAYNKDQTKVQIIDDYGNTTWASVEDVKAKKPIMRNGKLTKIDVNYRMACVGEADLVAFLKTYLCAEDAFSYVEEAWVKKANADEYVFKLEHLKDYFSGDVSELREAIAIQPANKVKMLYGVRTKDNKQYQTVCTRGELILSDAASSKQIAKLEKNLANAKLAGSYRTTDFRVCALQEYTIQPTNLEAATANASTVEEDDPLGAAPTEGSSDWWE